MSFLFPRRRSQVVRQRSAKPLFTGSNPVVASNKIAHLGDFCIWGLGNGLIIPPLSINQSQLRDGLAILDEGLAIAADIAIEARRQAIILTKTFDVIIVGGGMAGLSTAYHLARLGGRVLLLQANDLGAGSSAACSGRYPHFASLGFTYPLHPR